MSIMTVPPTSSLPRIAVSVVCLIAGVLFGLISVYSDTRAACAVWVSLALVFTFAAGLLTTRGRTRH